MVHYNDELRLHLFMNLLWGCFSTYARQHYCSQMSIHFINKRTPVSSNEHYLFNFGHHKICK